MKPRLRDRTVNVLLLLGLSVYQLIESSKQAREAEGELHGAGKVLDLRAVCRVQ